MPQVDQQYIDALLNEDAEVITETYKKMGFRMQTLCIWHFAVLN